MSPLYEHLATQITQLQSFNFGQLNDYDLRYAFKESISLCTIQYTQESLLYYSIDITSIIRYVESNYTRALKRLYIFKKQ